MLFPKNTSLPEPVDEELSLVPGDNSPVYDTVNLRLQTDGPYLSYTARGGTRRIKRFNASVLHATSLQLGRINSSRWYVLIQTSSDLFLYDISNDFKYSVDSDFGFTDKITGIAIGRFLYLFCGVQQYQKYFSFEDGLFEWNALQGGGITGAEPMRSGVGNDITFESGSVWGFKAGAQLLSYDYNENKFSKNNVSRIDANKLFYINANDNEDRLTSGFLYKERYSEIENLVSGTDEYAVYRGFVDIYNNQLSGGATVDTSITVGNNTSTTVTIDETMDDKDIAEEIVTLVNNDASINAEYEAELLESYEDVNYSWRTVPVTVTITSIVPKTESEAIELNGLDGPNDVRYETSDTQLYNAYSSITGKELFSLSRGYLLIDELNDGSYTISGKPDYATYGSEEVHTKSIVGTTLTFTTAADAVVKRYLCSTLWLFGEDAVFRPSSPLFSNSPFYVHTELDPAVTTFQDVKPDEKLVDPINGFFPMAAGISTQFGPNQFLPSVASHIKNTLVLGNYTISRPVPDLYDDFSEADTGNVYIESTGTAVHDRRLAIRFVYTDGGKSRVVYSGSELADEENLVQIHSLNSLVKSIIVGVTDDDSELGAGWAEISFDVQSWSYQSGEYYGIIIDGTEYAIGGFGSSGTRTGENAADVIAGMLNGSTVPGASGYDSLPTDMFAFNNGSEVVIGRMTLGYDPISFSYTDEWKESLNVFVQESDPGRDAHPKMYVFKTIRISDPEAHGYPVRVSADVTNLDHYQAIRNNIKEEVQLQNYLTVAVPGQSVLIDKQQPIANNASIEQLIPYRFNIESSVLRLRMIVLTNQDVQSGIIEDLNDIFRGEFEVIGRGVVSRNFEAYTMIGSTIYFQSNYGISSANDRGVEHAIDRYRYRFFESEIKSIAYHDSEDELWVLFDDGNVVVLNLVSGESYLFHFNLSDFHTLITYPGSMMGISGTGLLDHDRVDIYEDDDGWLSGKDIECRIKLFPFGNRRVWQRILELTVFGQGGEVSIEMDTQSDLREDLSALWSTELSPDFTTNDTNLTMAGVSVPVYKRTVLPRIDIVLTPTQTEAFIQSIRSIYHENTLTGYARR